MKFPDVTPSTALKWLVGILLLLLFVTIAGIVPAMKHLGFHRGYQAAFEDYRSGRIDCVVTVKYPEWLKQEKEQ
jgi:predicted double-glycine peptidase